LKCNEKDLKKLKMRLSGKTGIKRVITAFKNIFLIVTSPVWIIPCIIFGIYHDKELLDILTGAQNLFS
jgi:hypothetical protein